ncbi:MAG: hypothetical protein DRN04_12420 [Thermoprotei archaeon]|nr:MAG: hypothetical protein DRN04_12420 [Thermoprotei archaeon]
MKRHPYMGPACLGCPFMPSLNLLRYDEIRKRAGGELRILFSYLDTDEGTAIYHNAGLFLGNLEDSVIGLIDALVEKKIAVLHGFFWASIGDLKASLLLAFTGHSRQAKVSLRTALELFFWGLYFQYKKEVSREKAEELFEKWLEGTRDRPRFMSSIEELKNKGVITENTYSEVKDLYSELSKYIHAFLGSEFERVALGEEGPARPSSANMSLEELYDWYLAFGRTCYAIIQGLLDAIKYFSVKIPERTLKGILLLAKIYEKGPIKEPLDFVDCPFLKN